VEKSLKAFLVWRDHPFRKTHNLVELTQQCVDLEPALGEALRGMGGLTRFAGEYRYPGETELPSLELAQGRVVRVKAALETVTGLLPPLVSAMRQSPCWSIPAQADSVPGFRRRPSSQ